MKLIKFNKYQKKIKVIRDGQNLTVSGPLGTLTHKLKMPSLGDRGFYLEKDHVNYFSNKIKKLFKSVSTG